MTSYQMKGCVDAFAEVSRDGKNGNEIEIETKKQHSDKFPEMAACVASFLKDNGLKAFVPALTKDRKGPKGKKGGGDKPKTINENFRSVNGINLELLLKKAIEYYGETVTIKADKTRSAELKE